MAKVAQTEHAAAQMNSSQVAPWQYYGVCGHPSSEPISETAKQRRFRRQKQAKRWAMRTKRNDYGFMENPGQKLHPEDAEYVAPPRECLCGTTQYGMGSVAIVDDGEGGHYSHIARCGAVWTCPVCSGIIRHKRAEEINEAIKRHLSAGGGLLLVTETVQHNAGHKLDSLIHILKDSHRSMNSSRAYKAIRDQYGIMGYVSALEITRSDANGWHPHQHILVFTEELMTELAAEDIRAGLYPIWARSVERKGGYSGWEHGLDVQAVHSAEAAGQYLAKVAQEMTNAGDMKQGSGSITPFQLLDEPSRKNELLFREYTKATRGKSAIRWSRGLRDRLGMAREMTDEQLANETKPGTDKAFISRDLWATMKDDIELQDAVRDAVMRGDERAAARMMNCDVRFHLVFDGEGQPGFIPMFVLRT